jgi:transcriptional regulator with XRE-family HTH domain
MAEPSPWPRRLTKQIGKQIARHRAELKISARELSDRTEEAGFRIEYQIIANIESGRRNHVGVHELIVLGKALKVPPLFLLAPVGDDADVEILPGVFEDAWDVYKICAGVGREFSGAVRALLSAYEDHDALVRRWFVARPNQDVVELLVSQQARMRAEGWRLPRIPPYGVASSDDPLLAKLRERMEIAEAERGLV